MGEVYSENGFNDEYWNFIICDYYLELHILLRYDMYNYRVVLWQLKQLAPSEDRNAFSALDQQLLNHLLRTGMYALRS